MMGKVIWKYKPFNFFTCNICIFSSFQNRGHGLDMNVRRAWERGYTGKGVVVTILDDGIEKDHPDLRKNYVSISFKVLCSFIFML